MKIAFITYEYPPFVMGGAGVYASNLTRELARLEHEVHIIMPMVPEIPKELFPERIQIHKLNFINRPYLAAPSFWYSLRKEFPSLRRQVKEFDVVHINGLCDI